MQHTLNLHSQVCVVQIGAATALPVSWRLHLPLVSAYLCNTPKPTPVI